MMEPQWEAIVGAAVAVVGLLEWVKKLAPQAPSIVWHLALLPACLAFGLLGEGSAAERVLGAGVLLLVTQVGYQLLIQGVVEGLKGAVSKLKGAPGDDGK